MIQHPTSSVPRAAQRCELARYRAVTIQEDKEEVSIESYKITTETKTKRNHTHMLL